jgi:hypothetical protein
MQTEAAKFDRALRAGQKAARAMWVQTRDPQVRGPNEIMVEADKGRLSEWRRWLNRVVKRPDVVWQTTPVCGAWQLQFIVHNFAPAVQKVIVEEQRADGSWHELAGRFTIEFRAYAARPNVKIKREFTVPVHSPKSVLRLAVRGVGQVGISHISLVNGVDTLRTVNFRHQKIVGRRAPKRGLPRLDLQSEIPVLYTDRARILSRIK